MKYIEILNIVNDSHLDAVKLVEHEMKKHRRRIELSIDKEAEIKSIISSLGYEDSIAGNAYINSNYNAGSTYFDVRNNLTSFYLNSRSMRRFKNPLDVIKKDSLRFYTLFIQEVELWKILHLQPAEESNQYSKSMLDIFKYSASTITIFLSRIRGKRGVKVVNEIIALRELDKIKQEDEITNQLLFDEISKVFPIGSISSFNSAFILGSSSRNKAKRRTEIDDIKKAY